MQIIRTKEEIEQLYNDAAEGIDQGSKFPGMSYEEGIIEVLRWLEESGAAYPLEG
jgi:hypothetical protein